MILAGVLLKLGGYGLLRVLSILVNFYKFGFILISIRLVGEFLVSLICVRQTDLKSLIASSVAHIGIVIGGIITISYYIQGLFQCRLGTADYAPVTSSLHYNDSLDT
jgi:NADH-ubiquinone oxidoreductase chain 4